MDLATSSLAAWRFVLNTTRGIDSLIGGLLMGVFLVVACPVQAQNAGTGPAPNTSAIPANEPILDGRFFPDPVPVRPMATKKRTLVSEPYKVTLALTYAASRSRNIDGANFWMQGGALDLNARFYRGLGLAASVTGAQIQSKSSSTAPVNLVTVVFGPSYTIGAGHRISFYGEALLGEAEGFDSVYSNGSGSASNPAVGATSSADGLALQTGGAMDINLSRRFALRLFKADYLRTQLPNGSSNVQNNLRLAGGVTLAFGH